MHDLSKDCPVSGSLCCLRGIGVISEPDLQGRSGHRVEHKQRVLAIDSGHHAVSRAEVHKELGFRRHSLVIAFGRLAPLSCGAVRLRRG